MDLKKKIRNTETDEVCTVEELIAIIQEIKEGCTKENAINEINYSIWNIKVGNKMIVCKRCLMAIEAHEGRQAKKEIEYDDKRINDNDEIFCEWCEEFHCSSDCVEI